MVGVPHAGQLTGPVSDFTLFAACLVVPEREGRRRGREGEENVESLLFTAERERKREKEREREDQ